MFYKFDLIINYTESMPIGLYRLYQDNNFQKNDLVILYSNITHGFLLKKIAATAGDLVNTNREGVHINGISIKNTKVFEFGSHQERLNFTPMNRILEKNEIFVVGEHPKSFDSRYFGAIDINKSRVKKIKPVLIFKGSSNG
ncbi:S26 family signal peptidase [uncultured Campylobacter sp.]|uniref:S26 family signal peptidase n=1 Tax=uncultured Campylobacter sp. TaxID=218934 RepID=UPI002613E647|nr:S26 family signal peptidase [uncultured Campylobacter sp.]